MAAGSPGALIAAATSSNHCLRADVAELVDARDLKSLGPRPCGFDPRRPHQIDYIADLPAYSRIGPNWPVAAGKIMAGKEFGAIALALAVLAGCGDDPIEERAAEPRIRVVDAVSSTASCAEGEQLLSAYCF